MARSVFDKRITCCVRGTSVALYLSSHVYFPFTGFEEDTYCLSGLLVFPVTSICQGPLALAVPSRARITARSSRKPLIPSPILKPFFAIFQRQPSREPNMSSFRLLNLPPELRDPIRESILIPREPPHAARLVAPGPPGSHPACCTGRQRTTAPFTYGYGRSHKHRASRSLHSTPHLVARRKSRSAQ